MGDGAGDRSVLRTVYHDLYARSHGSDASDKVIFAQESAAVAKPGVVAKPAVASTSTPAAKG